MRNPTLSQVCEINDIFTGHEDMAYGILKSNRRCNLVIAPNGEPYLYRWHLVKTPQASVYFHIQVQSDPERPLHDHPWDNVSTILAGGYIELIAQHGAKYLANHTGKPFLKAHVEELCRHEGETIFRKAEWGHRLILPDTVPYSMSLFSCGAKKRDWGFWYNDGWVHERDVCKIRDGVSVHEMGAI